MPKGDKAAGRADAPGQNKPKQFINEATGEEVTGTMNDYHNTLKDQGYRPVDDDDEDDTEAPVEPPA